MADSSFPWDSVDSTPFVDPNLVDTTTGSFPLGDPGGIGDLGLAGNDTANGTVDTSTTFDWTAFNVVPGSDGVFLADGSQVITADDGSQIFISADGTPYDNVNVSPDGTIVQFADGSVLDVSTGKMYNSAGDMLQDPASTTAANNGNGFLKNLAKAGGGSPTSGATGQPGKPAPPQAGNAALTNQLNSLGQLLAKFGSGLGGLLGGTAVKTPANPQTVSQAGIANLGGQSGMMTILVIGGFGLLLVLTMKGN
jgi:hypothetical protein